MVQLEEEILPLVEGGPPRFRCRRNPEGEEGIGVEAKMVENEEGRVEEVDWEVEAIAGVARGLDNPLECAQHQSARKNINI